MVSFALAVFHNEGNHWADHFLKENFKHVFVCIQVGDLPTRRWWVSIDGQAGVPKVDILSSTEYDLASFFCDEGYTVVKTRRRPSPFLLPFTVANCVGMAKTILGVTAPWVLTPWQLHQFLTRRGGGLTLPGGSVAPIKKPLDFFAEKPEKPDPLPDQPTATDPSVLAARERQRKAELERRGRRATILTSASGLENDVAELSRPTAEARLLGRTGGG